MADNVSGADELVDDAIDGSARRRWVLATASAVVLVAAVAVSVVLLRGGRSDASHDRLLADGASSDATAGSSLKSGQAAALAAHVSCSERPESRAASLSRAAVLHFHAVAAVLCAAGTRTYPDGVWSVELRRVGTRGLAELVAALGRADDDATHETSCALYLDIDPALYFVDAAGRIVHPRYPRDGCGHLQRAAVAATNAIGWSTLSLTKVQLDIPKDPVARACGRAWKNMISVESAHAGTSRGGPVLARDAGRPLIVCRYHMSTDPVAGTYVYGTRLSAGNSATLLTSLDQPAPTTPCSAQQDFVVVHAPPGEIAYIELGGCWRVLRDDNTLGSANRATAERILGA